MNLTICMRKYNILYADPHSSDNDKDVVLYSSLVMNGQAIKISLTVLWPSGPGAGYYSGL